MGDDARTMNSRDWRFLLLRHFGPWGIVATGCWIVALIVYLKQPAAKRELPTECLITAIATTAICALYGAFKIHRAVSLLHNGIEVEGVVSSFGTFKVHGNITVNCSYEIGGKSFSTAWSGPADEYDLGDKVTLLVDPKRPAVCEQKASICREHRDPAVDDKPDSWKWWYYILAGIGFAAAAITCYIYPGFLKPSDGNHGAVAELYRLIGNWGFVGVLGVFSLVLLWIGAAQFRKQLR